MIHIEIYTRLACSYCTHAKTYLKNKGLSFEEYNVNENGQHIVDMLRRTSNRTFPQIFIDGQSIGGFEQLLSTDKLAPVLDNVS